MSLSRQIPKVLVIACFFHTYSFSQEGALLVSAESANNSVEYFEKGFNWEEVSNFDPSSRFHEKITVVRYAEDYELDDYEISGNKVNQFQFKYSNGEMTKYSATFNAEKKSEVLEEMKEKYGEPEFNYYYENQESQDLTADEQKNILQYTWRLDDEEVKLFMVEDATVLGGGNSINLGRSLEDNCLITIEKEEE